LKVLLLQPNDVVLITCQDPESKVPKTVSLTLIYKPSRTLQASTSQGATFQTVERVFGLKLKEIVQEKDDNEILTCDFVLHQKEVT